MLKSFLKLNSKQFFNFSFKCSSADFNFSLKVQNEIIKTGEKISKELLINKPINVKVLIYSFGNKNSNYFNTY